MDERSARRGTERRISTYGAGRNRQKKNSESKREEARKEKEYMMGRKRGSLVHIHFEAIPTMHTPTVKY